MRDDTQLVTRLPGRSIDIAYDTFGDRASPAVLLVMGLGQQRVAWGDGFCSDLASRGRFVVRFDNRDAGQSTRLDDLGAPAVLAHARQWARGEPVESPYALADMAADAVALLDVLEIDGAHLVGVSMGGAIAQEMAARWPARVASLTSMLSSTGSPKLPLPTAKAAWVLTTPAPTELHSYVEHAVAVWGALAGSGYPSDEDLVRARAAVEHARGVSPLGTARQLSAIYGSGDRTAALGRLSAPTLVIHGDEDPLIPLEHGEALAAAVPAARLEVIEGLGHDLPPSSWPRLIELISSSIP